jgi:general secretion pathway protein G
VARLRRAIPSHAAHARRGSTPTLGVVKKAVLLGISCVIALVVFVVVAQIESERCMGPISRSVMSATDVSVLTEAIHKFKEARGHLPKALEDLAPDFVRRIPNDPWNHPYQYELLSSERFRILGLGADGKVGGAGSAADLVPGMKTESIVASIKGRFTCN